MAGRDDLVNRVVEAEWKMFQEVPNAGGRASCQDDRRTFAINRASQVVTWPEAALESYLDDLARAEKGERNLLTEKYARMMESTCPGEYERIEHLLPLLDPEASALIDDIVGVVLEWEEEVEEKFPHVVQRGRPIRSTADNPYVTSLETYLRGELATYSPRTLRLLRDDAQGRKARKQNGSQAILEDQMKRYGFASLEEADRKLAARRG